MSGQLKCIRVWVRTIGMLIEYNDIDEPINPLIKQKDVKKVLLGSGVFGYFYTI